LAKKAGSTPGDVVRYVPAPEPLVAALAIGVLALLEVLFAVFFIFVLVFPRDATLIIGGATFVSSHNSVEAQQTLAFLLGSALLTLAAILSLYRKFFLPDVMIVKKRKLKYEDL
jgi:hypothetical protein